jgi:hypothetical protein
MEQIRGSETVTHVTRHPSHDDFHPLGNDIPRASTLACPAHRVEWFLAFNLKWKVALRRDNLHRIPHDFGVMIMPLISR